MKKILKERKYDFLKNKRIYIYFLLINSRDIPAYDIERKHFLNDLRVGPLSALTITDFSKKWIYPLLAVKRLKSVSNKVEWLKRRNGD